MTDKLYDSKRGRDLCIGDRLCGFGVKPDQPAIVRFKEHPGLADPETGEVQTARIVRCGDDREESGFTVFDDDLFRYTSDGYWVHAHLWFSHQSKL